MLFIQQARATDTSGLVSVLLEGSANSGKTALAAQLAKNSDFPFVKVCTPEEMVGFTESEKCLQIRKGNVRRFEDVVSIYSCSSCSKPFTKSSFKGCSSTITCFHRGGFVSVISEISSTQGVHWRQEIARFD
ncbi:vesicle-fusing ATPase 1-like [Zootermopsis nevadensis]|uniref:Vesicle-fusing ATPase n=1 Tax=Zootermopsis nevadensis TaxID=136037 RepID=A0A067R152_ZOONE|nr:vesicle-fusing ATPase 1-like [Zootermopsis nevadensis]KDR16529.1 Vesicle-fusing ATPase 1 [Zootermopsis nevadensis]